MLANMGICFFKSVDKCVSNARRGVLQVVVEALINVFERLGSLKNGFLRHSLSNARLMVR